MQKIFTELRKLRNTLASISDWGHVRWSLMGHCNAGPVALPCTRGLSPTVT